MVQNINTWYTVVEETTEVLGQRILQDYWRIRLIMSEWNMYGMYMHCLKAYNNNKKSGTTTAVSCPK